MWDLENGGDELICKIEIESQTQRTSLGLPSGEGRVGMNWKTGIEVYTLLIPCIRQIASENLLYSTGNDTQCSVVT